MALAETPSPAVKAAMETLKRVLRSHSYVRARATNLYAATCGSGRAELEGSLADDAARQIFN